MTCSGDDDIVIVKLGTLTLQCLSGDGDPLLQHLYIDQHLLRNHKQPITSQLEL